MDQGRVELDNSIGEWENRHADAMRLKREAEIVLPFLRAAVEELQAFRSENDAVDDIAMGSEPVDQEPATFARAPEIPRAPEVQGSAVSEADNGTTPFPADSAHNEIDATEERKSPFARKTISSLMTEAEEAAS